MRDVTAIKEFRRCRVAKNEASVNRTGKNGAREEGDQACTSVAECSRV